MTYGARTWAAGGALEMDTDSFTYQVLHNQLYDLTVTSVVTVDIPSFNPANCTATILPTEPVTSTFEGDAMPYMLVSAGQVQVLGKHPRQPLNYRRSYIKFRLLVMRFRN